MPVAVPPPTLTVIGDEPPAVIEGGLKPTVVPAGAPVALRFTDWATPLVTAVPIIELPLEPCGTLRLLGLAPIEKSEAPNVRPTVVVWVAPALVPVTVIVYAPGAVDAPTFTVIVEEPPAVTVLGLKPTVVPAGWPLALRLTACAEPLVTAVLIVDVPLEPCATLRLLGLAPMEKSDGAVVQPGRLNDPMRVCQLKLPYDARYSPVYQNVQ